MSLVDALHREAEKLREWSSSIPIAHQIGDWEIGYFGWPDVFCAWTRLLSEGNLEQVFKEYSVDIMYLVGRDASQRGLLGELRRIASGALQNLARLAISLRDPDVQLLCAWELADLGPVDGVEEVLLELAGSRDECVLLATLVSLADIGSQRSELHAMSNWRRIDAPSEVLLASLYALARVNSRQLQTVLRDSELHGDTVVQEMVAKLNDSRILQQYRSRFVSSVRSLATIECGFRDAVRLLRDWAKGIPVEDQVGEWACSFSGWEYVYRWWSMLIQYSVPEAWSHELAEDALYAFARDSENMVMLERIGAQGPKYVLALSSMLRERSDPDSRYQSAVMLGKWSSGDQCEALLLELAGAKESWVRQAAFRALAKLGSKHTERVAEEHWEAVGNDAFERQAILDVLWQFGSPRLGRFLERAEESNQTELVERARQIRGVSS